MNKLTYLTMIVAGIISLQTMTGYSQERKIVLVKDKAMLQGTNEILTYEELKNTLSAYPEAKLYLDRHKSARSGAQVLAFIGGGLIGWPLGTAIGGGDPEWSLLAIGAGLTGIGFAIQSKSNNDLREAVDIYNLSNGFTHVRDNSIKPTLIVSPTKLGLDLRF